MIGWDGIIHVGIKEVEEKYNLRSLLKSTLRMICRVCQRDDEQMIYKQ